MKNYRRINRNAKRNDLIKAVLERKFDIAGLSINVSSSWVERDFVNVFVKFRLGKSELRAKTRIKTDFPKLVDLDSLTTAEGRQIKAANDLISFLHSEDSAT